MKVIDRYVFMEMLGPFMIGVIGFVLVLAVDLLFTMADLIINKGIPLWAVLKLLLYKLPAIMVLTFPVSTLFATAMALGRLSKDNEIIALRTSGITLFRISVPIVIIGVVVSLASYITNEKIVPHANFVSSNIIRQIIYKRPLPEVKENVFFKDARDRYYYARRVDMKTKTMDNIMVYEITDERFPRVILADRATFQGRIWDLEKGIIHKYDEKGYLKYEAAFANMQLNVSEDVLSFSEQKTSQNMNSFELKSMINTLSKGGVNTHAFQTELYMKYSIPLTCFVFALIGIPFSLPSPRTGRTWGMVMTIVFMFTFYVFASVFRSLGTGGILPPLVAAFTPQVSFTILGGLLLFREGSFK
ncbi:MAG: LptF/LptG family permease [Candidatus Margulisbacteria bacterium]|nr:LptF/LptG family permease [Candidatus Margulisiibacteriota bacterium]